MSTDSIISKVWSFSNTLPDYGVSYGEDHEQLTIKQNEKESDHALTQSQALLQSILKKAF